MERWSGGVVEWCVACVPVCPLLFACVRVCSHVFACVRKVRKTAKTKSKLRKLAKQNERDKTGKTKRTKLTKQNKNEQNWVERWSSGGQRSRGKINHHHHHVLNVGHLGHFLQVPRVGHLAPYYCFLSILYNWANATGGLVVEGYKLLGLFKLY